MVPLGSVGEIDTTTRLSEYLYSTNNSYPLRFILIHELEVYYGDYLIFPGPNSPKSLSFLNF